MCSLSITCLACTLPSLHLVSVLFLVWPSKCPERLRLQLYLILQSVWSGVWLLLLIDDPTVNSIVSTGYSCITMIMGVKWNLLAKSHCFERLAICSSVVNIHKFLLPGQCGDDEEGIDRLVAASSESYAQYSTPQEQPCKVCRSVATCKCVALATV